MCVKPDIFNSDIRALHLGSGDIFLGNVYNPTFSFLILIFVPNICGGEMGERWSYTAVKDKIIVKFDFFCQIDIFVKFDILINHNISMSTGFFTKL